MTRSRGRISTRATPGNGFHASPEGLLLLIRSLALEPDLHRALIAEEGIRGRNARLSFLPAASQGDPNENQARGAQRLAHIPSIGGTPSRPKPLPRAFFVCCVDRTVKRESERPPGSAAPRRDRTESARAESTTLNDRAFGREIDFDVLLSALASSARTVNRIP